MKEVTIKELIKNYLYKLIWLIPTLIVALLLTIYTVIWWFLFDHDIYIDSLSKEEQKVKLNG